MTTGYGWCFTHYSWLSPMLALFLQPRMLVFFLINPFPLIPSPNWNFLLERKSSQIFLTAMEVTSNVSKIIMMTDFPVCTKETRKIHIELRDNIEHHDFVDTKRVLWVVVFISRVFHMANVPYKHPNHMLITSILSIPIPSFYMPTMTRH